MNSRFLTLQRHHVTTLVLVLLLLAGAWPSLGATAVAASPDISLGEAVDSSGLSWTTSQSWPWTGQTAVTHDGMSAAQSKRTLCDETSWIQTTVNGPGTVSFWWKASIHGEQFFLNFHVVAGTGVYPQAIDVHGTTHWRWETAVFGPGPQTLVWAAYAGCGSTNDYVQGWLDQVVVSRPGWEMPPYITKQPISQIVSPGTNLTFNTIAAGYPFPTYQWLHNGEPIPGATNTTFELHNVQTSDGGAYSVVASNELGTVTSTEAILAFFPETPRPGSLHPSLQPTVADGGVARVLKQPDGRILIGGWFSEAGGLSRSGIARLHPNGSVDAGFDPGLGANGQVNALALQPDGKVILGGAFSAVDGVPRLGLARLNSDGTLDTTFVTTVGTSACPIATAVAVQPDGNVLAGVWFGACDVWSSWSRLLRFRPDGALDAVLGTNVMAINRILIQPDGRILVAGMFNIGPGFNGSPSTSLVRLNADGTIDHTFVPESPMFEATALALQSDGRIVVGGNNGQSLARLNADGSRDDTFQLGPTVDFVTALDVQPTGEIVFSAFYADDGISRSTLGRLNPDGSLDGSFDPGAGPTGGDFPVWDILAEHDGTLLIGGEFSGYDGLPIRGLARVHGPAAPEFPARIVGWGDNNWGQLDIPLHLGDAIAVAAGEYHSMALRSDGTVALWGGNGADYEDARAVPAELSGVSAISANWGTSMALKHDGTVVPWGVGISDGYFDEDTQSPAELRNITAISAGGFFALTLGANGTVVAWGFNDSGQTDLPEGLSNVVAISGGSHSALALKQNGTVIGWGYNSSGQVSVPSDLNNVVAIAAGSGHSLALKADGTVVGWGNNTHGQASPPSDLRNVVAVAAGAGHSIALRGNGTLVAWGDNRFGQTSVPPTLSNVIAIATTYHHTLALIGDGSPVITVQPRMQTGSAKAGASFTVMAVGASPLTYQWRRNGVPIAGATNETLQLDNVQMSAADVYSVLVSNSIGTVVSQTATFTPAAPPVDWAWARGSGGAGLDEGDAIAVDPAGNVYISGIAAAGESGRGFFVTRYDPAGTLLWTRYGGGDAYYYGVYELAVDPFGNAYVAGLFRGTAVLGAFTFTSSSTDCDLFAAKFDSAGNVVWAIQGPPSDVDRAPDLVVDVHGQAHLAAVYRGPGQLDNVPLSGHYGVLLAKIDPAGHVLWLRQAESADFGDSHSMVNGLALDAANNVFLAGDLGAEAQFGALTVTRQGQSAKFVAKYDANGSLLWVRQAASTGYVYEGHLAVHPMGDSYLFGSFYGTALLGNHSLTNRGATGDFDLFLARLDSHGEPVWVRHIGDTNSDYAHALALDHTGAAHILGAYFYQTRVGTNLLSSPESDIYIARFDSAGHLQWVMARNHAQSGGSLPAPRFGYEHLLVSPLSGELFITGVLYGTNQVIGPDILTSRGEEDLLVLKLDSAGQIQWARSAGGAGQDVAFEWTLDRAGNAYAVGRYIQAPAVFGSHTLDTPLDYDFFVAKLGSGVAGSNHPGCHLTLHRVHMGGMHLTVHGPIGEAFTIETSVDFRNWSPLVHLTNTTGQVDFMHPMDGGSACRFYRLREVP